MAGRAPTRSTKWCATSAWRIELTGRARQQLSEFNHVVVRCIADLLVSRLAGTDYAHARGHRAAAWFAPSSLSGDDHFGEAQLFGAVWRMSARRFNEDLIDHRDRAVTPDFEQDDLAGGDTPAEQRHDVHVVGDQDDGLSWRDAR